MLLLLFIDFLDSSLCILALSKAVLSSPTDSLLMCEFFFCLLPRLAEVVILVLWW